MLQFAVECEDVARGMSGSLNDRELTARVAGWIATQVEVHHERKAGDALSHGRMLDLRENMSTFAEKSPLEADKLPQGWKPDRGTCCFFAGKEAAPVCGSRLPDRSGPSLSVSPPPPPPIPLHPSPDPTRTFAQGPCPSLQRLFSSYRGDSRLRQPAFRRSRV